MQNFFKQNFLSISVFITGACVLVVEVVALRVLSPHFGSTIFTVSSVISVILLALSVGYYVGGKLADRYPSRYWFFGIIATSGVAVLLFYFFSLIILPIMGSTNSLIFGPLVASVILFLVPAMILGTLSPYAVKLQSLELPHQGVGSVSGQIFFWSTLGSIVGSLLSGFVFIPHFGINYIFIGTGIVLFCLGFVPLVFLHFKKRILYQAFFVVLILVIAILLIASFADKGVVYKKDGIYEKIIIKDGVLEGRPTRFFKQDKAISGGMFLDTKDANDLVYDYTKYYSIYEIFKPNAKNYLVIGGGAYSIPKAILASDSLINVDVSEIEPSLFEMAKKYFNLEESSRIHNFTEDGRMFLTNSNGKYDVIFSDVYYSLFSIPSHLATVEFFSIAKIKLSKDGIFIANIIGDLSVKKASIITAEIKTFQSVFPNSYFFAVDSPDKIGIQNIIFVGYNSDKKIDFNNSKITQNEDETIRSLKDKIINVSTLDLSLDTILTDDFAPAEYLTAKMLSRVSNQ